MAAFFAEAQRHGAVIDALVNNAGISMNGFDARVARKTVDVNAIGAMRVTDGRSRRSSPIRRTS